MFVVVLLMSWPWLQRVRIWAWGAGTLRQSPPCSQVRPFWLMEMRSFGWVRSNTCIVLGVRGGSFSRG